jgi:hypothetical protein
MSKILVYDVFNKRCLTIVNLFVFYFILFLFFSLDLVTC